MQIRPRFRTDLVAQPIVEEGQRFVDVTDPDSGSTFRFYEVEYAVACAMDGNRDSAGLVSWAQSELGLAPSAAELETVVGTLADLGYLAPDAGDLELGSPGRSPMEAGRAPVTAESVELGRAGGSDKAAEVSVDLSQHLPIGTEDVKEAVRQSKVMDVAVGDDEEDDEAPTALQPKPVAAVMDEVIEVSDAGNEPIEIPKTAPPSAQKKAADLLHDAAEPASAPAPAPTTGGGSAVWLVILLLIAVAGAGGYVAYNKFMVKPTSQVTPPSEPAVAAAPEAEKKKEPVKANLEEVESANFEARARTAGVVAWIAEGEVAVGDAVIKLRGFDREEKKIADLEARLATYQDKFDRAQAAGDQAKTDTAQAKVEEKQAGVDEAKKVLATFVVPSEKSGAFEPTVELKAKVKEGDVLGNISGEHKTRAVFNLDEGGNYTAGSEIVLEVQDDAKTSVSCTIVETSDSAITVECTGGPAGGTEVALLP